MSIKTRINQLEQNNKANVLAKRVHFAAVHECQDKLNLEVMNDIAAREDTGQRCILFEVIPPKYPIKSLKVSKTL